MTKDEEYIYEPPGKLTASIIWLHGLGADGNDFAGVIDQLGLPADHGVRFIFPNAPYKKITVNQGMQMRAWYDIYDLNILRKEDAQGIAYSDARISNIIKTQQKEVASERVLLAGFSQGGAMALYTGLRCADKLGGIIALSSYLPTINSFDVSKYQYNIKTEIFMAHGMFDPVVPYGVGQESFKRLQQDGYNIEWNSYPMAHTISLDEIYAIGSFINRCLHEA